MAGKTEKKAGLPMAVALVALLLFVSVVGIVRKESGQRRAGRERNDEHRCGQPCR